MKKIGIIVIPFFLLPCLITFMFGNLSGTVKEDSVAVSIQTQLTEGRFFVWNDSEMGREKIPLELYVADKLARCMDADWELETLKAQAILIRSGLYWELAQSRKSTEKNGISMTDAERGAVEEDENSNTLKVQDEAYGSVSIADIIYQAVAETAGLCIMYDGKIVSGAYFAVSNGATRSGEELGLSEYPYLKSVLCSRDFLSEDYSDSVSFREEEFIKIWEVLPKVERELESVDLETIVVHRDSVGYVLYIEWQNECVSGEAFRYAYHVPSACFYICEEEEKVVIESKGAGHGLGMSQFGANEMAKEGKNVQEILDYFFKDVTITKIE